MNKLRVLPSSVFLILISNLESFVVFCFLTTLVHQLNEKGIHFEFILSWLKFAGQWIGPELVYSNLLAFLYGDLEIKRNALPSAFHNILRPINVSIKFTCCIVFLRIYGTSERTDSFWCFAWLLCSSQKQLQTRRGFYSLKMKKEKTTFNWFNKFIKILEFEFKFIEVRFEYTWWLSSLVPFWLTIAEFTSIAF